MPDVDGIKRRQGHRAARGSRAPRRHRSSRETQLPGGYVIETEPRAGASVVRGSLVDYVLSSGPTAEATARPPSSTPTPRATAESTSRPPASLAPSPFPSQEIVLVFRYLCLDLGTARAQLDEAGLLVGATFPDPAPGDSWIVHDQKPQPGESVPIGSKVDLVLMDPSEPCSG